MNRDDFLRESMRGTLAFARLGIVLAFAMNAVGYMGDPNRLYAAGMVLAALSAGLAYAGQCAAVSAEMHEGASARQFEKATTHLILASVAASVAAGILFIVGY